MHPLNRFLKPFGFGLFRHRKFPHGFEAAYKRDLVRIAESQKEFNVIEECYCDLGDHPLTYKEFECGFAATMLAKFSPKNVLDIGSYRGFVTGLSAAYQVTVLDVRQSEPVSSNERIVVSDAKKLVFDSGAFDAVVSLSSIEHFGLGRYGDAFDPNGDSQAFSEFKRCVKPGGILIVTTTITAGRPVIAFNAHRIYGRDQLDRMAEPFEKVDERFFNKALARWCNYAELPKAVGEWGVYCGCWRKPA